MPEPLVEKPFTVFAFWHQTWERFAWQVMAPDPRMAEDLTHMEAHSRGGTIGVCGVVEGYVDVVDTYATWIDPSCTSQEQMDIVRRDGGF